MLVYSSDHYPFWRDLGIDLPEVGAFAENLTVRGLTEAEVHIGDTFEVGSCVLQVTQPRAPCYKIAGPLRPQGHLHRGAGGPGSPGYLLRVLSEGQVGRR